MSVHSLKFGRDIPRKQLLEGQKSSRPSLVNNLLALPGKESHHTMAQ
jgi:hypothetical protein